MIALGIMIGSSLDGVDYALVDVNSSDYELIHASTVAFPVMLKSKLSKAAHCSLKEYLILKKELTYFVAENVFESELDFEVVSVHGLTTFHLPEEGVSDQMVCASTLSALLEAKVVSDFRVGDIALGGQGTPLVPIAEKLLFPGFDYYLNLGGIANLTKQEDWSAFDVCPCNQLNNYLAAKRELDFDQDGQLARAGQLNAAWYKQLGDFEFYTKASPKSLDNNWIRKHYWPLLDAPLEIEDKLHTVAHFIADQIAKYIAEDASVFVSGGGARNVFLIELLKSKGLNIHRPSNAVLDYKEAILMTLLGYLRLKKIPNILSSVSGATNDSIGGAVYNVYGK